MGVSLQADGCRLYVAHSSGLGLLLLVMVLGAMMGTFKDFLHGVLSQLAPTG